MTPSERCQTFELHDDEPTGAAPRWRVLLQTPQLAVVLWQIPAAADIPERASPGWTTLQCLDGLIEVEIEDETQTLLPKKLVCLPPHQAYRLRALETGAVLVTIGNAPPEPVSEVDEASAESFPASDPPAWTGVTGS